MISQLAPKEDEMSGSANRCRAQAELYVEKCDELVGSTREKKNIHSFIL